MRRLFHRLLICATATPIVGILYCYCGAKWCQHFTGSHILFSPATGTDAYDRWLINVPFFVVTIVLALLGLPPIVMVPLRKWPIVFILLLPVCFFGWCAFIGLCFPLWDDISP